MKRPQAMKRPKNESRGPGPAGGSGIGWAPKTDASSQPERVDKRPPSERPMWLFLSEPGLGDLAFTLSSRQGRFCLSAEDLITMALEGRGFEIIAAFGVDRNRLLTGPAARACIERNRANM